VVRTDPVRGLLFIKGSVPGSKGGWLTVEDAVKLPRHDGAPYPAGLINKDRPVEEAAPAGLVDDAAVHEIPALPGDDEVAAIAAEQEAGAAAEAEAEAAAEADADAAAQSADNQKADAAESDKSAPSADDSKES
jgi:large subunit ribosomal protein L3